LKTAKYFNISSISPGLKDAICAASENALPGGKLREPIALMTNSGLWFLREISMGWDVEVSNELIFNGAGTDNTDNPSDRKATITLKFETAKRPGHGTIRLL